MAGGDPEHLLPTLRSRVQRVRIAVPEATQALLWLNAQGVSQASRALAVTGGSPLAALALHEAGLGEAALEDLPRAVARSDAQTLLGKPLPMVIDLLQRETTTQWRTRRAPSRFSSTPRACPPEPHCPGSSTGSVNCCASRATTNTLGMRRCWWRRL